jgi:hypothetical protein
LCVVRRGNSVAVQSLQVLELLFGIRYENDAEGGTKWVGKVSILCFGTISISWGRQFSAPALLSSRSSEGEFSQNAMTKDIGESGESQETTSDKEITSFAGVDSNNDLTICRILALTGTIF